ncbi:CBF/Mak21 family-domain-containing protein [Phycomyces blakesleeanus]|uniref:CBF/Mak21 family-domain-containing protein n=1 Tax=Phycomyces blakesleeanus TaxID=4837 RepID=A0ABR3AW92_PHYBL
MPQPIKKRKRGSAIDAKAARNQIKKLEADLSDKTNLNNIVTILEFTHDEDAQTAHAAIHALHRVFTKLLMNGDLKKPKTQDTSPKAKVSLWLREQYIEYLNHVRSLISNEEPGLQVPALNILMSLLRTESEFAFMESNQYSFPNSFYGLLVDAIIRNPNFSRPLFAAFVDKYVNVYDDLRHYFYKDAAEIMEAELKKTEKQTPTKKKLKGPSTDEQAIMAQNVFSILDAIKSMPTEESEIDEFWTQNPEGEKEDKDGDNEGEFGEDDDNLEDVIGGGLSGDEGEEETTRKLTKKERKAKHPLLQLKVHKRSFSLCWIAMLKLPLTEEIYKKTLLVLHKRVLPHMAEPKMLMDFLTDSYNQGGSISLLALNGLFTLITEHNLDYPDFYQKLYNLLDRDILHVKYRSRFFRLLDIFLASAYLPAGLIASFIKRLARLSLTAPPAASVIVIPFIYNLLQRHPICMKLIHTNSAVGEREDPFVYEEKSPYECKALESSLWEMDTLAEHYYANVSTLAKIFKEQFRKPKYNMEDFLDHTYATFFKNEMDRKRKKEPAMGIDKPTTCTWSI